MAASAALVLAISTASAASGECGAIKKELARAQQAFAKATHDAEARQSAYETCKTKGDVCAKKKGALDDARAAKAEAEASLKSAERLQKNACKNECAAATKRVTLAGEALAAASHDEETRAGEYAQCKKIGGRCAAEKAILAKTTTAKSEAQRALDRAEKHKVGVCLK